MARAARKGPSKGQKKEKKDQAPPEIVITPTTKRGRPTMFRSEYCDIVLELGRKGKSKAQIAAYLDVSRQTLDNWCEAHPDFLDAIAHAQEYALAWWEEVGMTGIFMGARFNDRAWSLQVRNRFPKEYKESKELEIGGSAGGEPVKLVITSAEADL